MMPNQFTLRRLFLAVALAAFGLWMMLQLVTPSAALFVAGCALIGLAFGAAVGLLAGHTKVCTLLGATGWIAFGVFAVFF
ncbi:MAG: hypothetical protein WD845_11375 [Pirellulales bacterium]